MRRITHTLLSTLACGFALIAGRSAHAQADQLLIDPPRAVLAVDTPDHAQNVQRVGVNVELLNSLAVHDRFSLRLYDHELTPIVERVKRQAAGGTIIGRFEGVPGGFFTITIVDDAVTGSFFLPGHDGLIRLRYGGPDDLHYIHQTDGTMLRQCAGGLAGGPAAPGGVGHRPHDEEIDPIKLLDSLLEESDAEDEESMRFGCGPTDPTFDVMIVYSDDARADAGGTAAIQAEAINSVATMELTYLTCSVLIRTNIVFVGEVAYDESNSSYEDHLNRITDPDDGILDGLHGTRNVVDADFVSLFVADDESGGLGWCLSGEAEAFCVVRWEQAGDGLTLAHEVGHNIGCAHNPEDADCEPTEIGYGHNFFVPSEGMWRHSVMAYSVNGSTAIPYYSSPSCEYEGIPTGTPQRDNLAIILWRQYTCEDFRQTRMDVWVDFDYGGGENGSFSQPFDTLIEGVNRTLPNPVADMPVLHISPGSTSETLTISKPMMIDTCGGTVTIGQ